MRRRRTCSACPNGRSTCGSMILAVRLFIVGSCRPIARAAVRRRRCCTNYDSRLQPIDPNRSPRAIDGRHIHLGIGDLVGYARLDRSRGLGRSRSSWTHRRRHVRSALARPAAKLTAPRALRPWEGTQEYGQAHRYRGPDIYCRTSRPLEGRQHRDRGGSRSRRSSARRDVESTVSQHQPHARSDSRHAPTALDHRLVV